MTNVARRSWVNGTTRVNGSTRVVRCWPIESSRLTRSSGDVAAANGPTEAINGCLGHVRGLDLGFRDLTDSIAESLLETGGFRFQYTVDQEEPARYWLNQSCVSCQAASACSSL